MRGCEIKGLQWKQVDLFKKLLTIQRHSTKTNAGARVIPLNQAAFTILVKRRKEAELLGHVLAEHYVFCACENGRIDPAKPMKSWRSAWSGLRKKAGLPGIRFHDLRHQAITEMCEKGLPDMTIMQIAGHVSAEMLKHYSHIRTQAKRVAVDLLETPLPSSFTEAAAQDGEPQAIN
jgi:integrase